MKKKITPEEMLQIFKKEISLDGNLNSHTQDWRVISPLQSCPELAGVEWNYDNGATKLVIIFKDFDYVIKIPYSSFYQDSCSYRYSYGCSCATCIANKDSNGQLGEFSACADCDYYSECKRFGHNIIVEPSDIYGANENTPTSREWDYCQTEEWLYQQAKLQGVEACFAETRLLGFIDSHPIYVQYKGEMYNYNDSHSNKTPEERESTRNKCEQVGGYCFNVNWLTDLISFFGDEVFQKFMKFIDEYQINDLHSGNIGYINGVPVLIDYSGFNE